MSTQNSDRATVDFDGRWIEHVPMDQGVQVDQCRACGALVAVWTPHPDDPDQRSTTDRHEAACDA